MSDGTAQDTCELVQVAPNIWVQMPICRCWVAQPDTSGGIWCPAHGRKEEP